MFNKYKDCEWSDMRVYFSGARLTKIRGVSYKAAKAKELLHAEGDAPISIQGGNRENTGQIKMLKGALDDLNRAAQAAGGDDILDAVFDIVIEYRAKGSRQIQTDRLINVEVTEFEKAMAQGDKQMEVSLPILFLQLITE